MKGAITIYAIGKRIKDLRLAKGITQEELGSVLGIGQMGVDKIESDRRSDLSLSTIRLLSKTFDVFPVSLMYETVEDFWLEVADRGEPIDPEHLSTLLAIHSVTDVIQKFLGKNGSELIRLLHLVNRKGVDQTKAYVEDLVRIADYRKSDQINFGRIDGKTSATYH